MRVTRYPVPTAFGWMTDICVYNRLALRIAHNGYEWSLYEADSLDMAICLGAEDRWLDWLEQMLADDEAPPIRYESVDREGVRYRLRAKTDTVGDVAVMTVTGRFDTPDGSCLTDDWHAPVAAWELLAAECRERVRLARLTSVVAPAEASLATTLARPRG